MLQVLITIDTEVYPILNDWKEDRLQRDISRDIYGRVQGREVGLEYQLNMFARHGLKANFMVESLFAGCPDVGPAPLRKVVASCLAGGHEVQLHPHTEWLPYVPALGLPYRSHRLREFPFEEQVQIIAFAIQTLEAAGAPTPTAFRAGGFAADHNTLHALEACGIRYDTSFNPCYEKTHTHLPTPASLGRATRFGGVQELPVSVFQDWPSHLRPAQLCATSFAEMSLALDRAERQGWEFFVIVSHSFEMIANRWRPGADPVIRRAVVDRFERLCEFLSRHRDRFATVGFSDLVLSNDSDPVPEIKGRVINAGERLINQAIGRLLP